MIGIIRIMERIKNIIRKIRNSNRFLLTAGQILTVSMVCALLATGCDRKKVEEPERREARTDSDTVVWNGVEYEYNRDLSNYLILGIDTRESTETEQGSAEAGQADAIYVLSHNRAENTVTVISIPRDTMTEIELFSRSGRSMGTGINHLSLSYAYGDGKHESCRLTEEAVSNLLYDVPIQSYCALSLDGVSVLTESVGTVQVTVPNNSLVHENPAYSEGASVTLDGASTEQFLRYRDIDVTNSALERMERQQAYLEGFADAARQKMASEGVSFAADLYLSLEPYMVTSMGKEDFVTLAESLMEGTDGENWTVPGEGDAGTLHDEYRVDDDALFEKIIETFYVEVSQEDEH